MFRPAKSSLLALTCVLNLQAAPPSQSRQGTRLDLQVRVTRPEVGPAGSLVKLTLSTAESAYAKASTYSKTIEAGSFEVSFRSLEPGDYTLVATHPQLGEIRRTVVVSRDLADTKGVVRMEIAYTGDQPVSMQQGTGTLTQLSIPDSAKRLYGEAQKRIVQRDSSGAFDKLQQAVAIAPQFATGWNALGVLTIQTRSDAGAQVDAETYFRRAVEADASEFEALLNLGGLLLKSGRQDEALTYNRRAADERPGDGLANSQLGMNFYQLGELDKAEHFLLIAKRLDPAQYTLPQLFLAEIYARKGNRSAALAELEQLLADRPNDPLLGAVRTAIVKLKGQ
ncbi:MAG: tetratricopeptide repeat protein [Acidobacteriota bacterium]